MAKSLSAQRQDEYRAKLRKQVEERQEFLHQQRMLQMEMNAKLREKESYIDTLVDAIKNNEDVNTYAKLAKKRGFDFEECVCKAAEIVKRNSLKSFFKDHITQNIECQISDFDIESLQKDFGFSETYIKKAFSETQNDIYKDMLSREQSENVSTDANMQKLYLIGQAVGHEKSEIDNEINESRKRHAKWEYEDNQEDFVSKWRFIAFLLIVVAGIIEWFTLHWWIFLVAPITIAIILPLYNKIAKLVFKSQHQEIK